MRFIANIYRPDGPQSMLPLAGKTRVQTYVEMMEWLTDKQLGEPRAVDGVDSRTLSRLGIVGVYIIEPSDEIAAEVDRAA